MQADHPRFHDALAAVDAGDVTALRALLDAHPELVRARVVSHEPPYDGYFSGATLLHHLAGNPLRGALPDTTIAVAELLLARGAAIDATCGGGPNQPASAGGTLLGLVASSGQAAERGLALPLIDRLLAAGAQLDATGDGGIFWVALYHTVECRGQRDVAAGLHERGHPLDLPFAAGIGRLDRVTEWFDGDRLRADADRFFRHHRGGPPLAAEPRELLQDALLAAAVGGQDAVVDTLIERGAEVNGLRRWGPFAVTPLHGAAWAGWPATARRLVRCGADLNARDPEHHSSPVGWAAWCRREETVQALLEFADRYDLANAVEFGCTDRVVELLGDGDPDQAVGSAPRGTLLRTAAALGHLELVRLLLARGAEPNLAPPDGGVTALDLAVARGHVAVADLLRERGGCPDG